MGMGCEMGRIRMREKKKVALVLGSMLFVSLLLTFIPQTNIDQDVALQIVEQTGTEKALVAGDPHSPIFITGNGGFQALAEAEGWPGDGNESSPYIIEGFDFDLGGSSVRGIDIVDTTVHFIIRDCIVANSSAGGTTHCTTTGLAWFSEERMLL
jgi:hypothetical protein